MPIHLFPEGEPVEVVSHFQYLGSIVQDDCGMDTEINSRICKASSAFQSLSRILWHQRKIQTRTKARILNSVILPTFLYGLESSVFLEPSVRRLSPLWSVVCGSSWEFQSGRRSDTPPYARWPSSRGSHPFSLSAVCVSLGTYPGCQRKDYLSSLLFLPLLGVSVLTGDRSVGGVT